VLPRQFAARRSPIRAGAQARRSTRPSGPPYRAARADQMAIVKPSASRPRSRSRRRSALHEMVDAAPAGHQPPRGMCQRSPASSLSTRRTAFSDSAQHGDGARPRALFRLTSNRRWPHMAHGTPRPRPSSSSPNPRPLTKCREFWDSNDGRSRTRTWEPLPYQRSALTDSANRPLAANRILSALLSIPVDDVWTIHRSLRSDCGRGGPVLAPGVRGHGVRIWCLGATLEPGVEQEFCDRG
jgi:hypothetical protein